MKRALSGGYPILPEGPVASLVADLPRARTVSPALVYLAGLAEASRRTQTSGLKAIAEIVAGPGADPLALPWGELRHEHVAAVRGVLADSRAPATANRLLAALRGVLRAAWRLGVMDGEAYRRAIDVPCVRGRRLPAGRELGVGEIRALLDSCGPCPRGRRDAALLALLYGAGLRRAEAVAVAVEDLD
ncbi:MAG: integrase, partial [Planctomycetes bacterium]|nr:integrase [Planctomycetota bacterium]